MNDLEKQLNKLNPALYSNFLKTKEDVTLLLGKYAVNFPQYTDHSITHTNEVFNIAADVLVLEEIESLNDDEIYVLSMACILHDIGMCISEESIQDIIGTEKFIDYRNANPNLTAEDYLRDIHHLLSQKFILNEWESLGIVSEKYAEAIGLVSAGHRKVDIGDFQIYNPRFFVKNGKEFVCLPYLAAVLRIADELDVTNIRTPKLLTKYYMPKNDISIKEWSKHIATSLRNYYDGNVAFQVTCTDQNIYAALQEQFDKIQSVINLGQKVIRSIPLIRKTNYSLSLTTIVPQYTFKNFDPKGIRFSFDVQNVVTAFIGEDLYKHRITSLREAIQNSIDTCRYKKAVLKENFTPIVKIYVNDEKICIVDNGAGMDEFVIENFFGRLASSFYEQEKVRDQFEAIGQFGVGVFSYFLIAEYVDIETKTSKSEALKFRFDKDPKSYFHFFDDSDKKTSGTVLTLNLKDSVKEELSFNEIESYVKKTFKHIEFPIEINSGNKSSIIEQKKFTMNSKAEIFERLRIQYRKLARDFEVIEVYIDNDEVEGICGMIVKSNTDNSISSLKGYFDHEQFSTINSNHDFGEISISQKGVFVANYSGDILNFIIGTINLKKKHKISIDRNKFVDLNPINFVIQKFEFKIIEKFFEAKKGNSMEEKLKNTNHFFTDFLKDIPKKEILSEYEQSVFLDNLVFSVVEGGISKLIFLRELASKDLDIVLVEVESGLEKLSNDLFILKGYDEEKKIGSSLVFIFRWFLSYHIKIHYYNNAGFYIFRKNKEILKTPLLKEIWGYAFSEILESNSSYFIIKTFDNGDSYPYFGDSAVNYNHWFIQMVENNFEEIKTNKTYLKICKEVIESISKFVYSEIEFKEDSVVTLNDIIEPFNKFSGFKKFNLSNDFENL